MTGKTYRLYLQDILEYLDKALSFTTQGRDAFYADEMAQFAVIRVYEVIGEIVKRLPSHIQEQSPSINWRQLAGFRDFLAHNYDEILIEFVWQAIEDLPQLRQEIQLLLDNLPSDIS